MPGNSLTTWMMRRWRPVMPYFDLHVTRSRRQPVIDRPEHAQEIECLPERARFVRAVCRGVGGGFLDRFHYLSITTGDACCLPDDATIARGTLGCKPKIRPGFSFSLIKQSIVQPMRLSLPELDTIRDNSEASPERWTWNCAVAEPCARAREFLFEKRTRPVIVALCGDAHALRRLSRGRV